MREIKFRGLRCATNKWIYGYLVINAIPFTPEIFEVRSKKEVCRHAVYENSIGQYTGIKDVKGVEIYEGDLVDISSENDLAQIGFENGEFMVSGMKGCNSLYNMRDVVTVRGNIYENMSLYDEYNGEQ